MPKNAAEELIDLINNGKTSEAIAAIRSAISPATEFSSEQIKIYFDITVQAINTKPISDDTVNNWMDFSSKCSLDLCPKVNSTTLSHRLLRKMLHAPKDYHQQLICFFKYHPCTIQVLKETTMSWNIDYTALIELLNALIDHKLIANEVIDQLRVNTLEEYNYPTYVVLQEMINKKGLSLPPLSDRLSHKLDILNHCPLDIRTHLHNIMIQLTRSMGRITSDTNTTAATILLAAIKQAKENNYDFSPTVIMYDHRQQDFLDYLKHLITLAPPIRERFLLTGAHWRSGEIEIDDTGHVKLFILDPSGGGLGAYEMKHIGEIIADKKITFYFTKDQRQHSLSGCSVFALDDVRHFHTIEKYAAQGKTLFQQLDERIVPDQTMEISENINAYFCKLPVSLMRTMQSRGVFTTIETEKDHIINKAGKTATDSTKTLFSVDNFGAPEKNIRLDNKREKMAQRVGDFIDECIQHNPEEGYKRLCNLAHEHTLEAFIHRTTQTHGCSKNAI